MNIQGAQWLPNGEILATIDDQVWSVPDDMGNRHRRAIAEWEKAGGVINKADPVPEIIDPISRRQFFAGLEKRGKITKHEALAAVKLGTLPAVMKAVVDNIPDADQRYEVDMMLSGASMFERNHEFVPIFANAINWNSKHTDDFWKYAGTL